MPLWHAVLAMALGALGFFLPFSAPGVLISLGVLLVLGLLAIRRYHLSRGDEQRTICLIPSSAHGTNAASAVLAGLRVVVVACRSIGDVELDVHFVAVVLGEILGGVDGEGDSGEILGY